MAAINPSSALRACRYMQRCRQARRHSSTVSSSLLSRYDPSNFTRARGPHRFPPLAPSPPAPQTTPPDDTTPRPLRAHPSTPPTSPSQTTISTLRASTPIPWGTRLLRFARLSRPPPPATDPTDTTPFNAYTNPYRAHKSWPPDVPSLHPKEQFRFEKTYRRRSKLKWARPRWNRRVKLLQHTLMVSVLIYFVFIAEPRDMGTPFDGVSSPPPLLPFSCVGFSGRGPIGRN